MRLTLLQPALPNELLTEAIYNNGLRFMPLNLAYLASVLENAEHEVSISDLNIQMKTVEQFSETDVHNLTCDIVGITSTTASYLESLKLASVIKTKYPDMIVVLGGSHVTFTAETTLRECPYVDFVVRGEAEHTFLRLVEAIENRADLSRIAGISFRHNSHIRHNEDAPLIRNLNSIPYPARHLLTADSYPQQGIVASRGCPRKCIFCSAGAMSQGKYRVRSAENIVGELRHMDGQRNIAFYDNTFSGNPRKSMEICRAIIKDNLDITWATELRVDSVSDELLELLINAGCQAIQFGVESGNSMVLADIKKHITLDQVRRAVDRALSFGLQVACSFTIGHPSDTRETIADTTKFMLELKEAGCQVWPGIVTPYPGTEIYEHKDRLGITIHDYDWSHYHPSRVVMSTEHLTREKLGTLFMESLLAVQSDILQTRGDFNEPTK